MGVCILRDLVMMSSISRTSRQMKKWGPGLALLFMLSAFVFGGPAATAQAKQLAIIAGKSFPVDTLTLDVLQDIYMGEKQIIGSVRLKPIDQRDNQPIKFQFLDRVLHLSRDGYITYWNNRLFREGGIPPIPKQNSEEVILTVEETVGAIGYVYSEEAKAARDRIKILITIDVGP